MRMTFSFVNRLRNFWAWQDMLITRWRLSAKPVQVWGSPLYIGDKDQIVVPSQFLSSFFF